MSEESNNSASIFTVFYLYLNEILLDFFVNELYSQETNLILVEWLLPTRVLEHDRKPSMLELSKSLLKPPAHVFSASFQHHFNLTESRLHC